jgi:hypothetical protein
LNKISPHHKAPLHIFDFGTSKKKLNVIKGASFMVMIMMMMPTRSCVLLNSSCENVERKILGKFNESSNYSKSSDLEICWNFCKEFFFQKCPFSHFHPSPPIPFSNNDEKYCTEIELHFVMSKREM